MVGAKKVSVQSIEQKMAWTGPDLPLKGWQVLYSFAKVSVCDRVTRCQESASSRMNHRGHQDFGRDARYANRYDA